MAEEDAIWALGCMSGTSMDGVDAAMVLTDGERLFEFGATGFRPYSSAERAILSAAQGRWPGDAGVAEAAAVVERAHVELIARFGGVALVGFHGQTLAHDPRKRGSAGGRTHQVGNGADVAAACGLPVAWDFRKADVAAGGQGAPLAPFYHFALTRRFSLGRVAFLNLGGVGNVSFVDPNHPDPASPGALLGFDTGPANALMDDLMQRRTGLACDYGGALAASGRVKASILADFLRHPYFTRKPPKSLDRNEFSEFAAAVDSLSDADALATLAAGTVASASEAILSAPVRPTQVLVSGGGRKNAHLMAELARALPMPVLDIDAAGMDGDMLEAQAFAYLAVRVQKGLPLSAPGTTAVPRPQRGGRISPPRAHAS